MTQKGVTVVTIIYYTVIFRSLQLYITIQNIQKTNILSFLDN